MSELLETRKCPSCRQTMPLSEFFGKEPKCKHCLRQQVRTVAAQSKGEASELDRMLVERLENLSDIIPSGGDENLPDQGTMVEDILRPFGGSRGLGLQLAATYVTAKPGSAVRQRILQNIMQHVKVASELGYAKKPLEMLSDEELEDYAEELARRTLRIKDATEAAEEPEPDCVAG